MNNWREEYWSSSKLAEWIKRKVGIESSDDGLTFDGWKEWENNYKSNHPIAYYITEKLLNNIQDIVHFPFDVYKETRRYIRNRFILQTHLIDTKLEKGNWYITYNRILYGMFESLVDYVEIDQAFMYLKFELCKPYPNWRKVPSRELGMARLKWESSLLIDDVYFSRQAMVAREVIELYTWWKDIRPNRVNKFFDVDTTNFSPHQFKQLSMDEQKQEDEWDKEDLEMATRLLKIRTDLWT
ncbi:MAG: hypothetical protein ACXW2E_00525 [Nitrososphaeraceae archaeon]